MQWTLHKSHIEHTTDTLYLAHYGAPLVFWIKKNTKYLPSTSKLEQQFWRPAHSPPRDAGQRRYCMQRQYLAAPKKMAMRYPWWSKTLWALLATLCAKTSALNNYSDVITVAMTSQITGVTIVYSTVCSGADQRRHQSSASLAFVRGIHRWPVNSPHRGRVARKRFPFDDVIMIFL